MLVLATPAGARESVSSARRRRDDVRAKRAQAAARLNTLKASDAELERAVDALGVQVKAQTARVVSARQAVGAAEAALAQAEARLSETEREIVSLQSAVVNRAVAVYVRPQRVTLAEVAQAKDLGQASRRYSMLQQVANGDRDVIDRLRAAKEDQVVEEARANAARDVAAARRRAVEAELAGLQRSLAEKAGLERALDVRIREFQAEVDALASQEAAIGELIRSKEAALRATRSAAGIAVDGRVSGVGLMWPIRGVVTSEYGYRWGRLHAGIDISAPTGTPIRAAKAGDVIHAGYMGGYGNVVIVDHGGGLSTLYAHQSRIASSEGQSVGQGQVVGYVGSTGRSTGPHLHLETRSGGSPQNPRRYLP
jgi:murein DD-endopeptidase MepM/ murein hydrolase activator NlpD